MPRSYLLYTWVDMWEDYPNPYGLEKDEFKSIISTFNHILMRDIIDNGSLRKLPMGLGMIYVAKRPITDHSDKKKRLQIESPKYYSAYRHKLGLSALTFRHSGYYFGKIVWSKYKTKARNATLYVFSPLKNFVKHMAYMIREKHTIDKYWEFKQRIRKRKTQ